MSEGPHSTPQAPHTEAALRESEERLRLAAEVAGFGTFDYDLVRDRHVWSPETYRIYGFPTDAPLDIAALNDAIHPDDRPRADSALAGALDRGDADLAVEYRIRRRDGDVRHLSIRSRIHYAGEGASRAPARILGAVQDVTDQRLAEARLRAERERLERILESTTDSVFVLDRDWRFSYLNANARSQIARGRDLVGTCVWDAFPDLADTGFGRAYRRAIEIQRPTRADEFYVPLDTWFEAHAYPSVDGLTVFFRDVTEERRAGAELVEREALLDAVLEALPVGVIIADASGRILRDNAANRELWGVPPETEDWTGYGEWVGYRPETGERIGAGEWAMSRALLRGEVVRGELVENERFGTRERRFYLNNAAPVRDAEGRIVGGVVAELDVTERLAAERALAESEERFRELADNMSQFAWTADAAGSIYWYNKRWYDYTGTTPEEMRGWGWTKVHHPDHVDRVVTKLAQAFATGQPWEDTFPLRGRDGGYRWFLARAEPIRDDGGGIVRWFGTNTDVTERIEAEKALAESERRLSVAAEAAGFGTYEWDVASNRHIWSPATYRIYGIPSGADLSVELAIDAIHPDDRPTVESEMADAFARGADIANEYRIVRPDGEVRQVVNRARVVYAGAGADRRPVRLIGAVRDATEQHEAEAAIRESEARFRTLAEAMPALVYTSRERRNTYVNARYAEYTGLPPEALLGDGWRRVLHPDDARSLGRGAASSGGDGSLELEVRLRRADGQWRWHLVRGMLHPTSHGLWVGAMVDIHDRHEAEARLAKSEARYRTLFESIDAGFCVVEMIFDEAARPVDYRFVEVNPAFERQTGLGDAVGRTVRELLPGLERHWFETYGRVATTGEAVRFENGSDVMDRWFDVYAVPAGETPPYRVGVLFNDISQRRRAEEEVRRLNRDLEALVEARTRRLAEVNAELQSFAYSVSHDLRAPLRAMQGFSLALVEDYGDRLDEPGRDYVDRIAAGAKQMDALIQDLLAYSRLARDEISLEPVSLDRAVDEALKQMDRIVRERSAVVEVDRPLGIVVGHAPVLRQVVVNLLSNAVKFVSGGKAPRVGLRSERRGRNIRLWVEDNGIGIATGHRERIFEVFQRLHGTAEYPGTGIGLAIVRKGVERLGGAVGVESEPGEGSRFWIELPRGE